MIDIDKGRYWDFGWQLIDGCTPCSPGCDNCWSASMTRQYGAKKIKGVHGSLCDGTATGYEHHIPSLFTTTERRFNGKIEVHLERLSRPLKRKKPTVYAIWNDLYHEDVPITFIDDVFEVIAACPQHTFLILTKRASLMEEKIYGNDTVEYFARVLGGGDSFPNIWHILTICTQKEADENIPIFLTVPGNKGLCLEPMLEPVDLGVSLYSFHIPPHFDRDLRMYPAHDSPGIDAVILGGETGPKARPMNPDWARSVRDQCQAAGVPFFFKSWGEYCYPDQMPDDTMRQYDATYGQTLDHDSLYRVGNKAAGRILDGVTHDDLPWVKS